MVPMLAMWAKLSLRSRDAINPTAVPVIRVVATGTWGLGLTLAAYMGRRPSLAMDMKTLGWPVIRGIMTLARPRVTHADMTVNISRSFKR